MTESTGSSHIPSEDAKKWYGDYVAEVHRRQISGSENFDKSVLTLSSAGLGLSVGLLKGYEDAPWLCVLYLSWTMFTIATIATMVSFLISGRALEHQKRVAYRCFIDGQDAAFDEPNKWDAWNTWLVRLAAGSFALALVLTVTFMVLLNSGKDRAVSKTNANSTSTPTVVQKGAPVPSMQKVPASAPAAPVGIPAGQPHAGAATTAAPDMPGAR